MNAEPRALEGSTCPRHPEAPAVGACTRCGSFVCAQDLALLGAKTYCTTCAARPDVDYLEAFRLGYWGKRDGWAWFFGLGGVLNLALAVMLAAGAVADVGKPGSDTPGLLLIAAVSAAAGLNGLLYWLGKRIARFGLLAAVLLVGAAQVAVAGPLAAMAMVLPLAVAINVFMSWRAKLFFKIEVPRPVLQRAWDLLHNNSLARQAAIAGVAGFGLPLFAPLAIIMGVIGLRRVDPTAWPPIGKKGYAIAGIVLGVLALVAWTAGIALYWREQ